MRIGQRFISTFSDSLSAGFPSAAEGYEDEPLDLATWLIRNPAATFFYRVAGDALHHEYIRDGSILVVDRSIKARAGRLVVAERDGMFVVARFDRQRAMLVHGVVIAVVTKL